MDAEIEVPDESPEPKRADRITLRIPPDERDQWVAHAKGYGISLSNYVRLMVNYARGRTR